MSDAFQPQKYEPAFLDLLQEDRLNPLGPGKPNQEKHPLLKALTVKSAFAYSTVKNPEMAQACLAGIWLYHNFLDESHRISQNISNTTGSYWHGIMHRREPDASNSAYWFRRVGTHPIFIDLHTLTQEKASPPKCAAAKQMQQMSRWDPYLFINLCEEYRDSGTDDEMLLRGVQLLEWELLFDYSYRQALGV